MGKKLIKAAILALVFTLAVSVYAGYAGCHKGGYCPKMHEGKDASLKDKIIEKAHFLFENKDELGLSDDQVAKIKEIKIRTKKEAIKADADIEIAALDVESAMWEDKIDVEAVGKLIDKKYDLKKENAKAMVKEYAELKGVLTAEQETKVKAMMKDKMKEDMKCMMGGMMKEGKMGMGKRGSM